MTITLPLLLQALHLVLALVLFYTCFCRQTRSTAATTKADVRGAFWLLSIAAVVVAAAPYGHLLWPELFQPDAVTWPDVLLLAGIVLVQVVTARHWRDGVPTAFLREAGPTQWPWPPGESSTLPPLRAPDHARLQRHFQEMERDA